MNLYEFLGSRPMNLLDPMGLSPCSSGIGDFAGGFLGGMVEAVTFGFVDADTVGNALGVDTTSGAFMAGNITGQIVTEVIIGFASGGSSIVRYGVHVMDAASTIRDIANGYPLAAIAPVSSVVGHVTRKIKVYRGISGVADKQVHKQSGALLSDAGRTGYFETPGSVKNKVNAGLDASKKQHKKNIETWGSEDNYVQAHGAFGVDKEFTDMGERSMVSFTRDRKVAEKFAGEHGTVVEKNIRAYKMRKQTLPGSNESEYLVANGAR